MDEKLLFTKILGLHPPWFIKEVEVEEKEQRIDIYVDHEPDIRVRCPVCNMFYGTLHEPISSGFYRESLRNEVRRQLS